MTPVTEKHRFNETQIAELHDQALARAAHLRREAFQDFWRGGNAMVGAALATTQRSAQRLAARMQHHKTLRSAPRMG